MRFKKLLHSLSPKTKEHAMIFIMIIITGAVIAFNTFLSTESIQSLFTDASETVTPDATLRMNALTPMSATEPVTFGIIVDSPTQEVYGVDVVYTFDQNKVEILNIDFGSAVTNGCTSTS